MDTTRTGALRPWSWYNTRANTHTPGAWCPPYPEGSRAAGGQEDDTRTGVQTWTSGGTNASRRYRPGRYLVLVLLLSCSVSGLIAAGAAPAPLRFGIFPCFTPARMEAVYGPFAAYLGGAISRPVHFQSTATFEQFSAKLATSTFDLAFVNAFDYRMAVAAGYLPLARPEQDMATWFLVRPDSPAMQLDDLRGEVVALPPRPAALSHMGLYTLQQAGLTPGQDLTIRHFISHQSCLHHLLLGDVAACVSGRMPRQLAAAHYNMQFRLLHEGLSAPPPLFVVHQRLAPAERIRIGHILTHLRDSAQGQQIQADTGFSAFVPTDGTEYARLRDYLQVMEEQ